MGYPPHAKLPGCDIPPLIAKDSRCLRNPPFVDHVDHFPRENMGKTTSLNACLLQGNQKKGHLFLDKAILRDKPTENFVGSMTFLAIELCFSIANC